MTTRADQLRALREAWFEEQQAKQREAARRAPRKVAGARKAKAPVAPARKKRGDP